MGRVKRMRVLGTMLFLLLVLISGCIPESNSIQAFKESGDANNGYNRYSGPILGLQSTSDLRANRTLTYVFNFDKATILDTYEVVNETISDEASFQYPLVGSLGQLMGEPPIITVNDQVVSYDLVLTDQLAGFTTDGMNLDNIATYEQFTQVIGNPLRVVPEVADIEIPVTLYTLSNIVSLSDEHASTLALETQVNGDQSIMTIGLNGGSMNQQGYRRYSLFVSGASSEVYLIVMGGPLSSYTLKGYEDGGCDTLLEGVTADVAVETSTLSKVLPLVVDAYNANRSLWEDEGDSQPIEAYYSYQNQVLQDLVMDVINEEVKVNRYDFMALGDLMNDAMAMERVIYLTFDQPIKEAATIKIAYEKGASLNFNHKDPYLYDVAYNRLGDIELTEFQVQYTLNTASEISGEGIDLEMTEEVYKAIVDIEGTYFKVFCK